MLLKIWLSKVFSRLERPYEVYNTIEVSRSALRKNVRFFQQITEQQVIPVLKGNAYGHGIELVAQALPPALVPYVAVDGYHEALRVRSVSRHRVLVMGPILKQNYPLLRYDGFAYVVHDPEVVRALGKTGNLVSIHLEINTGMNRMGAKLDEIPELLSVIRQFSNLRLEGVMGHLADSDGTSQQTVDGAVQIFDQGVEMVLGAGFGPTMLHVAQTAGSVRATSRYANAIRLGIGTYGLNPFAQNHAMYDTVQSGLHPALQLTSRIAKIIDLEKGESVSYNYTFTAPHAMRIGVLPLGYFEGVHRGLSNKGVVGWRDRWTNVVGRVCMNHTMISLDGLDAKVGDRVVIYGNRPDDLNTIDRVSAQSELFNYNLLTSLSPDVRRTFSDS